MEFTHDCWDVLELASDADERSIKRQYAKRLKLTRPDENPAEFQQLRDAYEQALQYVRNQPGEAHHAAPFAPSMVQTTGPSPLRPTLSMHERAVALFATFADSEIETQWQQASAQGFAAEFERLLLQRCVNEPEEHLPLLQWGLEQRLWLTPWQAVPASEFQQQRLVLALTAMLSLTLERQLKAGEQEHFYATLEHHSSQTWLADFTRRQALQAQVLNLLIETDNWSSWLLQKVRKLYGWEVDGAIGPIGQDQWQALLGRGELKAWLDELRALAARGEHSSDPTANAAALFLMSNNPERLQASAATFVEADWQACEQLSATFTRRFAQIPGLSHDHDPWFWKALIPYQAPPYGMKRSASVLTLCLALQSLATGFGLGPALLMLPLYLLGGILSAYVGKWFLTHWTNLSTGVFDIDVVVSEWCVRHGLTSDRGYLVIRNAGYLLALGLVIWSWVGLLGVTTYLLTGLIAVLQPPSARPAERQYSWRKPLQAIYRIAGLSWLQWLFCLGMIGVIAYVQLHSPGTFLTHGSWR